MVHVIRLAALALTLTVAIGCATEEGAADATTGVDAGVASGGCGWDDDARQFACGLSARPPTGDPAVPCTGDSCTFTDPDAMCFIQTCDYATGTITTCVYSAGACPCDQTEECGAP